MLRLFLSAATVSAVTAHGSLVSPLSRNAIDRQAGVNCAGYECDTKVSIKSGTYGACVNASHPVQPCLNGQAAFYYSQGCFIGCPACDHVSGRVQADICGSGKNATLNDPVLRSINRYAKAGSPEDIYRHNPWRAPGNAPTANPCGLAGGTPWGQNVGEAGQYTNTSYAHHGTTGSSLPALPTNTTWKIGGEATVTWHLLQNHGGGYSYRLCPVSEELSEACFEKHPLDFIPGKSALLMPDGSKIPVSPQHVSVGTQPAGSTWSMVPIPPTWLGPRCIAGPNDTASTPHRCLPGEGGGGPPEHMAGCDRPEGCPCVPCPQTAGSDCSRCGQGPEPQFPPLANYSKTFSSSQQAGQPIVKGGFAAGILDVLRVPNELPAGHYVLQWRWDCEATSQVWTNCADISLAA